MSQQRPLPKPQLHTPPLSTILVVLFIVAGCSPAGRGPLAFQAPTGWKVDHKTPGGLDFFTVTGRTPDEGVLMFSPWPPPAKPGDIPALVQKLADGFRGQAKMSSEFKLANEDGRVEPLVGGQCQGSFAAFQITSRGTNLVQAMFMVSVGGRIWSGQFTGPAESWKQALGVLKSLKQNDR